MWVLQASNKKTGVDWYTINLKPTDEDTIKVNMVKYIFNYPDWQFRVVKKES